MSEQDVLKARTRRESSRAYDLRRLKNMVVVKLHMFRGCCNSQAISKKQIEISIEEFIKEVEAFK